MAKKKTNKFINPTEEHQKAMRWCLNNNIKVAVKPTKKGLKVEINDNGTIKVSPIIYDNDQAVNKCWELYLYIYKKYWTV